MKCTKCGKEIDNNSKFCEGCGEAIVAEIPTAPKKKLSKKLIAIIAVVVAAVILVVALASGGDSSSLTVPYDNDAGAVLNMTLEQFNTNFNQALDDISEYVGQGENNLEIDTYWDNMVEPMTEYESDSGKLFTTRSAFIQKVVLTAKEQENMLQSVDAGVEATEYETGDYFGSAIIMACSGATVEEATEIIDTIVDGATNGEKTLIYKDGILYSLNSLGDTRVYWQVSAASEEFVQRLEDSGNCNVLRW